MYNDFATIHKMQLISPLLKLLVHPHLKLDEVCTYVPSTVLYL
jgi:hypothetical protein